MNNWKIMDGCYYEWMLLWMLNYVVNLHSLTPLWRKNSPNSKLTESMQYTQKV